MRIVKREEFLAMPQGTLYCHYRPQVVGNITIKASGPNEIGNDYCYQELNEIDVQSSEERHEKLEAMLKDSALSVPLDAECTGRDGCFDDSELYLVYEMEDVAKLLSVLIESFKSYKEHVQCKPE